MRRICHAPRHRGASQAADGSGCHSSAILRSSPASPWEGVSKFHYPLRCRRARLARAGSKVRADRSAHFSHLLERAVLAARLLSLFTQVLCLEYCVFSCSQCISPPYLSGGLGAVCCSLSVEIFQNFRKIFNTSADTVANGTFHHVFSMGNFRFLLAQNVVGIYSSGLNGRELVKSGVEGGAVFLVQNNLLRGQGREHHIRLKARVNVQGALVMLPLAALVAVTLTAPGGENDGDLVGNFQSDILGQVGIVTVQFDGCHM